VDLNRYGIGVAGGTENVPEATPPSSKISHNNNNNIKYSEPLGCNMPTVSISLSPKAYNIYAELPKTTRSNVVSAALLQWHAQLYLTNIGDEE